MRRAWTVILLVASNKDVASLNIKKQILTNYSFRKCSEKFQENPVYEASVGDRNARLVTLNTESIYAQDLTTFFNNPELVVFMSRHSSLSGTPTLSVHTPGNLGEAELGGIPRRVSVSPANAMRDALKAMARLKQELRLDYEVSYECTHHGPSLDVPAMFSELGSSPKQWNDPQAAEAVAHATMAAVSRFGSFPARALLGIGGPHYQSKFTRLALESDVAFGHMIPKYAVSAVDPELLKQCIGRTLEKTQLAVLDWKGIKGEDKAPLLETLKDAGIPFEKA
jgi:D-aminoacyl-tRNA deacylase